MAAIQPYEGDRPYIFISYAHANSPAVIEVVQELVERGFRIWYDEGIEVGSEWPEYIAQHLADSSLMIAFLSNAYMRSDSCRKEMHYALTKRIPVINVFLEDTQMTPGMEMQIGNLFALMKYSMNEESFYDKLMHAPQLDAALFAEGGQAKKLRPSKRKKVPIDLTVEAKKRRVRRIIRLSILLLALAACITLAIIGWSTGFAQRLLIKRQQVTIEPLPDSTVVRMDNPFLEQAVRSYVGISDGDLTVGNLASIRELYIIGNQVFFSEPEAEAAVEGSVQSLADLRYLTGLNALTLYEQPLNSLESLPICGIEYLAISSCPLASLQGIGNLPRLREISANDCPVRELGDLEKCLQLRRMSLLGSDITNFSGLKSLTRLAEVELSNCGLNELGTLMGLSSLTDVAFYDCDLRGGFFKAFDRERSIVSLTLVDCKLNSTDNLEDFKGLTIFRLIRTGENLNWSVLAQLPVLKTVYVDESTERVIRSDLSGSAVEIKLVTES